MFLLDTYEPKADMASL